MSFKKAETFVWFSSAFIAIGIICNEWIAALFSSDGVLEPSTKFIIWLFDILMILTGILIITFKLRTSRFTTNLALMAFSLAVSLMGAELLLRFTGNGPWQVEDAKIDVEPGGTFFAKNATLGYTHLAGKFEVILSPSYSQMVTRSFKEYLKATNNYPTTPYTFNVTHLNNTLRITHPLDTYKTDGHKDEIWIFGCSLTHGWSLDDEQTYPWLLQKDLANYEIVNFGVTGYGTVQSLIQLREALRKRSNPKIVIVTYASFHDARNTFLRRRRKEIVPLNKLGPLMQPCARLNKVGKLRILMTPAEFREFPLMRCSAFMNSVEKVYDYLEDVFVHSHEVSKALIKECSDLCKQRGIVCIVAGIRDNARTRDILNYAKGQGILATDISVDNHDPENINLPYDNHPSPIADQKFAQKLESFLKESGLISTQPTHILTSNH